MQSIRRAAFRSAVSASRTVSSTTRTAPFSSQIARSVVNVAKPVSIISAARFFSQTGRVANEEKTAEKVSEVAQPAEESQRTDQEFVAGEETPYGVFIRNLIFDATEEHLGALFAKFGDINHVVIARDAAKLSKGYGFVFFKSQEAREEAVRDLDGSFWHGRRIQVAERAGTRKREGNAKAIPGEPTESLYIGNIPYETTDAELNEVFKGLENVKDVRVAVDRTTGWPRGFAHVDFADVDAAKVAHEKLSNFQLGQRKLIVDFAQSKTRQRMGGGGMRDSKYSNDRGSNRGN